MTANRASQRRPSSAVTAQRFSFISAPRQPGYEIPRPCAGRSALPRVGSRPGSPAAKKEVLAPLPLLLQRLIKLVGVLKDPHRCGRPQRFQYQGRRHRRRPQGPSRSSPAKLGTVKHIHACESRSDDDEIKFFRWVCHVVSSQVHEFPQASMMTDDHAPGYGLLRLGGVRIRPRGGKSTGVRSR